MRNVHGLVCVFSYVRYTTEIFICLDIYIVFHSICCCFGFDRKLHNKSVYVFADKNAQYAFGLYLANKSTYLENNVYCLTSHK